MTHLPAPMRPLVGDVCCGAVLVRVSDEARAIVIDCVHDAEDDRWIVAMVRKKIRNHGPLPYWAKDYVIKEFTDTEDWLVVTLGVGDDEMLVDKRGWRR